MCDCISKVDEQLATKNTRVQVKQTLNMKTGKISDALMVPTEKIETSKRGKAMHVFATFCPFCGNRIRPLTSAPEHP